MRPALADAVRVEQVLLNLVVNARGLAVLPRPYTLDSIGLALSEALGEPVEGRAWRA